MSKKLKFTVENTGGVSRAELVLSFGVNVLRGQNGIGKSSCIDAVVRASGGKTPIQRKDGSEEGRVTGPGVTLTVRKVVKTEGAAELELADVGPLGRLIEPGLKNSDAAARERVRALVELLGIGVDESKLLALCDHDPTIFGEVSQEVHDHAIDNLLEASEKLRAVAHRRAREQEELVAIADSEVISSLDECRKVLELVGGVDGLTATTVEVATDALESGIRAHDRALSGCEARERLELQQAEIKETMGPAPDVSKFETELVAASSRADVTGAKLTDARAVVVKLEFEKKQADQAAELVAEKVEEARGRLATWEEQTRILEKTPEGPDRDQVEDVRARLVEGGKKELERAQLSDKFRSREKEHDRAVQTKAAADDMAKGLRTLADGIPEKLGKILAEAGAPGLTVLGRRLHVVAPDGPTRDFERRCSTGERVKAALDVAATVYAGGVLSLDGRSWAALDPENRAVFARAARERELCVITEEPATGPLRVELDEGNPTTRPPAGVQGRLPASSSSSSDR